MKSNKREIIIYFIIVLVALIMFCNFPIGHFAVDTYAIYNMGYKNYAKNMFLKDGRPFSALLLIIGDMLNIPIKGLAIISVVIGIFISCLTVMTLRKIMLERKDAKSLFSKILVTVIAFITVFNFMYIENLYFLEAMIMALAVYLSVVAAQKLVFRNNKGIYKSFIYLVLATFCYNGAISVYVASVFMFLIINNEKNFKKDIKILINACIFCVIVLSLNLIQIKIVCHYLNITQGRINGLNTIAYNLQYIILNGWKVLINTSDLFPKYLFVCFLVAIFTICICASKESEENFYKKLLIFTFFSIISSFVLYLFTLSSFGSGRLHTNIGMLIGYLLIAVYIKSDILDRKSISKYCLSIIILLYFIINTINIFIITKDHQQINKMEKQGVLEINKYIEKYEEENDIEIKYIAMKYIRGYNEKAFYKRQNSVNCIGLYGQASFDGIVNFYTGRNLKQIYLTGDLDEKYMELINGTEPTTRCVEDVLVCVIYVV